MQKGNRSMRPHGAIHSLSPDTVSVLREPTRSAESPLRFFRLAVQMLCRLASSWRLITEVFRASRQAEPFALVRSRDDRFVGGLVQVAPASFVCYPLLGRNKHSLRCSQNGAWDKSLCFRAATLSCALSSCYVACWNGTNSIFGGPGQGVYATSVRVSEGHAEALLRLLSPADAAFTT